MKAKELKLGNWIDCKIDGCNKIDLGVQQLDKYGMMYLCDVDDDWDRIEPIPLTENNLLMVYDSDISSNKTYCFTGDKISVSIRFLKYGKSNICIMTDDEEIYIRNHIKYIHTFQNLIFALTNKELTLK